MTAIDDQLRDLGLAPDERPDPLPRAWSHAEVETDAEGVTRLASSGWPLAALRLTDEAEMVLVEMPGDQAPIYVDRFPVIVEQYQRFLDETGHPPPLEWTRQGREPDRPVEYLSWLDAAAYATWAGACLPRVAEWRRAAGGPEASTYPWGEEDPREVHRGVGIEGQDYLLEAFDPASERTWYEWNRRPPELGFFPTLASAYGLEELGLPHGVAEWCWDPADCDGERVLMGDTVGQRRRGLEVAAGSRAAPDDWAGTRGVRLVVRTAPASSRLAREASVLDDAPAPAPGPGLDPDRPIDREVYIDRGAVPGFEGLEDLPEAFYSLPVSSTRPHEDPQLRISLFRMRGLLARTSDRLDDEGDDQGGGDAAAITSGSPRWGGRARVVLITLWALGMCAAAAPQMLPGLLILLMVISTARASQRLERGELGWSTARAPEARPLPAVEASGAPEPGEGEPEDGPQDSGGGESWAGAEAAPGPEGRGRGGRAPGARRRRAKPWEKK